MTQIEDDSRDKLSRRIDIITDARLDIPPVEGLVALDDDHTAADRSRRSRYRRQVPRAVGGCAVGPTLKYEPVS
jgi:hypothetical protein